ncbi:DUF805 domain-containing protein [Lacticaseibacillus sp. GG6-2]
MIRHTCVGFVPAQRDFWRGYLDFYGRTTRAGYWWVQLVLGVVFSVVGGWLWLTASWQALLVAGGLLFVTDEVLGMVAQHDSTFIWQHWLVAKGSQLYLGLTFAHGAAIIPAVLSFGLDFVLLVVTLLPSDALVDWHGAFFFRRNQ